MYYAFMDVDTARAIKKALKEKTGKEFTLLEVKSMVRIPTESDDEIFVTSKEDDMEESPIVYNVAVERGCTGLVKKVVVNEVFPFKD